mmetsp:Transcript_34421/g.67863  ORF Transcript_34421/g.67863 Transcript_34421/m.67863 type:complete len:326 (-) Transcript_34421:58-1035(-)
MASLAKGSFLNWFEYHFKIKDRVKQRMQKLGESRQQAWDALQAEWAEHDQLNKDLESFTSPPANVACTTQSVALMFLTIAPLQQETVWMNWFKQARPDQHEILVHNDKGGSLGELGRKARSINPPTRTGWATSGLVRATILLLREALKNPCNSHFVLLSNSDLPVLSFPEFYESITASKQSRFNKFGLNWDEQLGRTVWQGPDGEHWSGCTRPGCFSKADQWSMWVREDAQFFAENNFLKYLKPKALFVDEPYFVEIMHQYDRPFENKSVTYTEWKFAADSPCTFSGTVSDDVIDKARKSGSWFLRKVTADAELSERYKESVRVL